jgi:hypothetical protein
MKDHVGLPGFVKDHGIIRCCKINFMGTQFEIQRVDDASIVVVDPKGSKFKLVSGDPAQDKDSRGQQPGDTSGGLAVRDLTSHVPLDSSLQGIGRFY